MWCRGLVGATSYDVFGHVPSHGKGSRGQVESERTMKTKPYLSDGFLEVGFGEIGLSRPSPISPKGTARARFERCD